MTPPASPHGRRRLRRIALAVAGMLALGAVAFTVAMNRIADPERLADWLQPRLSTVLKRDVAIGAASVGMFPPRVELREVAVADSTGLSPALARVEAIRMRFDLLPLLRRKLVVGGVELVRPVMDLRVRAGSLSNLPGSPDSLADDGARPPVSLELRRIEVVDGRVSYENTGDSSTVLVDSIDVVSAVRAIPTGAWSFEGTIESRVGRTGSIGPALADVAVMIGFAMDVSPGLDTLTFRDGSLDLEGLELTLTGKVGALKDPIRHLDLAATATNLPLASVVEAMLGTLRARVGAVSGTVEAGLALRGPFGRGARPNPSGLVSVAGGRIETPSGSLLADAVEGHVELLEDGSITALLDGRILGGETRAEGSVVLGSMRRAILTMVAEPDLALLSSFVRLPEGTLLTGQLGAGLQLDVPLDRPADVLARGDVTLSGVRLRTPRLGVAVTVEDGVAHVDGRRLTFADLAVDVGLERLLVSGELADPIVSGALAQPIVSDDPEVGPYLEASIRGPKLTLPSLSARAPADTSYTYGRVAFAHLGGRHLDGLSGEEAARELHLTRPDALPMAGRLSIAVDTLVDRTGRSEDVRAEIEFGSDFIRVTEASLRRYGGRVVAGVDFGLGSGEEQPFTMRLTADSVEAGAFLGATTTLGGLALGTLSVDVEVGGRLDELLLPTAGALVGGGRFTLTEGTVRASPLTERVSDHLSTPGLREPSVGSWSTSFTVEAGVVRLAESTLQGAPATPRLAGVIGLDGTLDLAATFDLPRAQLDSATVSRLGGAAEVARRALRNDALTRAVLRVGGSVDAPEVSTARDDDPSGVELLHVDTLRSGPRPPDSLPTDTVAFRPSS